jgi:hypothetical protein
VKDPTFYVKPPPWRTPTVVMICEAIRQAEAWDELCVLADALEESGHADDCVRLTAVSLAMLRHWSRQDDPVTAQRLVALVYSDETFDAARRIDAYAAYLGDPDLSYYDMGESGPPPMDYRRLMTAAGLYADTGDDGLGDGSMKWSNATRPEEGGEQFWKDWSCVTGRKAPQDTGGWLACTC